MVRIAGFHPADPGSIPGDEVCLGMTLKAPKHMYPRGQRRYIINATRIFLLKLDNKVQNY